MKVSIRNLVGWLFACLLIRLGFVKRSLEKAAKGECMLSVYFHKPSESEFETCIKWLKKKGFQFLSTAELDSIIRNKLPIPKQAIILTVDDGWQSNEKNIVEVAEKHKVPVTIFVSTEPVEQGGYWWSYLQHAEKRNLYFSSVESLKKVSDKIRLKEVAQAKALVTLNREALTVEQVKQISTSAYITIGGHTHSHPILVNCTDLQVVSELKQSREKLEIWTGRSVSYFAYPNGDYGLREINTLQSLGYSLSFCSEPRSIYKDDLKNHYQIPRCGFLEGASFAENICRIAGVWHPIVNRLKSPLSNKYSSPAVKSLSQMTKSGIVMLDN